MRSGRRSWCSSSERLKVRGSTRAGWPRCCPSTSDSPRGPPGGFPVQVERAFGSVARHLCFWRLSSPLSAHALRCMRIPPIRALFYTFWCTFSVQPRRRTSPGRTGRLYLSCGLGIFLSPFFQCVPAAVFHRGGFSSSFPSSTVKSISVRTTHCVFHAFRLPPQV